MSYSKQVFQSSTQIIKRTNKTLAKFKLYQDNKSRNNDKMLTERHLRYIDMLNNDKYKILFAIGYPGTGKTRLSSQYAVQQLTRGNIEKVIITRPIVSLGGELGSLPGNMYEKMTPWIKPIDDCFLEYMSPITLTELKKRNIIQISPLGYIRGLTFSNSVVIVDESQNLTSAEFKCLLTRIGENCKMILTGDTEQSDLNGQNGLVDFINRYKAYSSYRNNNYDEYEDFIGLMQFLESDILRSGVAKQIIKIYNY